MAAKIDVTFLEVLLIFSLLSGLCAVSFLDFEEFSSLKYGIEISSKPVILRENPEPNIMHMHSKNGQTYACALPVTIFVPGDLKPDVAAENGSVQDLLDKSLNDSCFLHKKGWWTYKVCYKKQIEQYHVNDKGESDGATTILGHFSSEDQWKKIEENSRLRYHNQFYLNGSVCDLTGKLRKTTVQFVCDDPDREATSIMRVEEPSTCEYKISMHAHSLCLHPMFHREEKEKATEILCSPALSEDQYEKYMQKTRDDSKQKHNGKRQAKLEDLKAAPEMPFGISKDEKIGMDMFSGFLRSLAQSLGAKSDDVKIFDAKIDPTLPDWSVNFNEDGSAVKDADSPPDDLTDTKADDKNRQSERDTSGVPLSFSNDPLVKESAKAQSETKEQAKQADEVAVDLDLTKDPLEIIFDTLKDGMAKLADAAKAESEKRKGQKESMNDDDGDDLEHGGAAGDSSVIEAAFRKELEGSAGAEGVRHALVSDDVEPSTATASKEKTPPSQGVAQGKLETMESRLRTVMRESLAKSDSLSTEMEKLLSQLSLEQENTESLIRFIKEKRSNAASEAERISYDSMLTNLELSSESFKKRARILRTKHERLQRMEKEADRKLAYLDDKIKEQKKKNAGVSNTDEVLKSQDVATVEASGNDAEHKAQGTDGAGGQADSEGKPVKRSFDSVLSRLVGMINSEKEKLDKNLQAQAANQGEHESGSGSETEEDGSVDAVQVRVRSADSHDDILLDDVDEDAMAEVDTSIRAEVKKATKKMEEAIQEKLKSAGLGSASNIKVKIITSKAEFDKLSKKSSQFLPDDEAFAFKDLLMGFLGGDGDKLREEKRQKSLEENYNFNFDEDNIRDDGERRKDDDESSEDGGYIFK